MISAIVFVKPTKNKMKKIIYSDIKYSQIEVTCLESHVDKNQKNKKLYVINGAFFGFVSLIFILDYGLITQKLIS